MMLLMSCMVTKLMNRFSPQEYNIMDTEAPVDVYALMDYREY